MTGIEFAVVLMFQLIIAYVVNALIRRDSDATMKSVVAQVNDRLQGMHVQVEHLWGRLQSAEAELARQKLRVLPKHTLGPRQ